MAYGSSDGLRPGTWAKFGEPPKRSFGAWRTLTLELTEEHARATYCPDYSAAVAAALGTEFQEPEVCCGCVKKPTKLGKGKTERKGSCACNGTRIRGEGIPEYPLRH